MLAGGGGEVEGILSVEEILSIYWFAIEMAAWLQQLVSASWKPEASKSILVSL